MRPSAHIRKRTLGKRFSFKEQVIKEQIELFLKADSVETLVKCPVCDSNLGFDLRRRKASCSSCGSNVVFGKNRK